MSVRVLCRLQLKLPQIQKIMMEFERQSEIMDMKEEMMNDAIDDAMGDEDDEEERLCTVVLKGYTLITLSHVITIIIIIRKFVEHTVSAHS